MTEIKNVTDEMPVCDSCSRNYAKVLVSVEKYAIVSAYSLGDDDRYLDESESECSGGEELSICLKCARDNYDLDLENMGEDQEIVNE